METSRHRSTIGAVEKIKMSATETHSQNEKELRRLAMTQCLHDSATRTQRARPALRRQPREQALDAALATATAAARRRQPRDLRDGLRVALVNRRPNTRRRHLITVTNQRVG